MNINKKIKILDVTLRDGGIVNNFNFGEKNMNAILSALEQTNIEYIELGYLDSYNGYTHGKTKFLNEQIVRTNFLKKKKPGIKYALMIDYGKFDVNQLENRRPDGVDAIRFAFHKRNFSDVEEMFKTLINKGYEVFMQPMVTMHYSDSELEKLVELANKLDIKGLYFVDTFGQMRENDLCRLSTFFNERLRPDIALGFHSHNNIQMSYANAISFLKMPFDREIMIDCSILGMGRGAGNLNTELLLEHINKFYTKQYDIIPLLNVIDTTLNLIKSEFPWGYSIEYYLSSINDCSPIYASHYYNKHLLPVEQINRLLKEVKGEKRISFDKEYAEKVYRDYNARNAIDDFLYVEELKRIFSGKKIMLIAPGKSISTESDTLNNCLTNYDYKISLNFDHKFSDLLFVSREEAINQIGLTKKPIISVSNLGIQTKYIIDYLKWIYVSDVTRDSAGFIILNLLSKIGVAEIGLAGFDGFTLDANNNYFSENLKRNISGEQLADKNNSFSSFIKTIAEKTVVKFITKSVYDKN